MVEENAGKVAHDVIVRDMLKDIGSNFEYSTDEVASWKTLIGAL